MSLLREIYLYASQASILIPVIAGIRYSKILTRPFKLLFYFFIVTILFEIQAEINRLTGSGNNMPGLHLYTVVEFLAFSMLFYLQAQKKDIKSLLVINAVVFLVIAVVDAVWIHGIKGHNDLSRCFSAVSMTTYALGYLYYLFTIDDTKYMHEYPMFWICIGMLFYFATDAIFFVIRTQLIRNYKSVSQAYNLAHAGLNIVAYCLYAKSFRCLQK